MELFDYCKMEISKPKYQRVNMYDGFNVLFMKLSALVGSEDYIALQDKLLNDIDDKSSYEAKKILCGKIDFYRNNKQPEKAFEIIRNNLQIESFREELTKRAIEENKFQEAKKLIEDFISQKGNEGRHLNSWYVLKLQIAKKENDIPEIRCISFRFLESSYHADYYKIYRSTFTIEEWPQIVEKLIQQYEKLNDNRWFNTSVADILQAEKQEERLLKYIEKHLSIDHLEKYYAEFSSSFPEKTLALFRQVIDKYAQRTGRDVYEHIAQLFGKMSKIEGGKALVREMITQYRTLYRSRRAMMEILDKCN
jgi:hypothetical protein